MAQTQHYEPTASASNAWAGCVGFAAVGIALAGGRGWARRSEARAAM
jgi:hypothetical protein